MRLATVTRLGVIAEVTGHACSTAARARAAKGRFGLGGVAGRAFDESADRAHTRGYAVNERVTSGGVDGGRVRSGSGTGRRVTVSRSADASATYAGWRPSRGCMWRSKWWFTQSRTGLTERKF